MLLVVLLVVLAGQRPVAQLIFLVALAAVLARRALEECFCTAEWADLLPLVGLELVRGAMALAGTHLQIQEAEVELEAAAAAKMLARLEDLAGMLKAISTAQPRPILTGLGPEAVALLALPLQAVMGLLESSSLKSSTDKF